MDFALKIAAFFEYGVLVLLFALSIWSIAIMIDRRRALARARAGTELEELRSLLERGDSAESWIQKHPGWHASVLAVARRQSQAEAVDRAVRSHLTAERLRLEKGLPVLATLGANAPFIGLFGTVLGIIRSFAALGENSSNAASVMTGISQALIATAAGLFVAIPAVVAFNTFNSRLRTLISEGDSIKDLWTARLVAEKS